MVRQDTVLTRVRGQGDSDIPGERARVRLAIVCLLLMAPLLPGTTLQAQSSATEGRASLLDLAARAEVDGYGRLDELTNRSAALPNVFDPSVFSSGGPSGLRQIIKAHVAWLESARAAHIDRIEALPGDMAAISTSEPYKEELVAETTSLTPERLRLVSACYDGERAVAEAQLAFLEFMESSDVLVADDGFTFVSDDDVIAYTGHIASVNEYFRAQNSRVDRYYAWELEQKARLRRYRDRL